MVAGGGEDGCKEDGLQDDACVSGVWFGELENMGESADEDFSVGCDMCEVLMRLWSEEMWYVVGFQGLELRGAMWEGHRLWFDDLSTPVLPKPSFPSVTFSQH